MTENEIRELIRRVRSNRYLMRSETDYITKALEEVQQYRAIGTLEELKEAMKYVWLVKKHGTIGKALEECAEYESIGTPEEFRAAMEKQTDEKPTAVLGIFGGTGYECKNCGSNVCYGDEYCRWCGQKLDWGDEE